MLLYKEEAIAYSHLTKTKLKQLYCRFRHLFVQRLAKVLKRAKYANINQRTIERLTKYYKSCQLHAKSLGRFKFTLKDNYNFNYSIIINMLYLNGKLVL